MLIMSGVLETLTLLLMLMLLLLLLSNDLTVGTSVVYRVVVVVVERRMGADVLDDVPGMIFERQMSLSCCE
jgi:hypothetical protein